MAHISPAVNLIWACLAVMLGTFLVYHLWSFDRFKCLRWNHNPYSGAFKRIMTYSYLLSVPCIVVYSVGFAIIKYTYGFAIVPGLGIAPVPYEEWSQTAQNAIFPLYLSFSIAWGLELLTHLEELCFWLFLVNSKASTPQDWFQSLYFRVWAVGSCIAVVAMPLITTLTRRDVYKCEAYTFLAGGLASISLTIWFLPILWTFPSFLATLKDYQVGTSTLVRLTTFHELNCIRVVFRFLFTVPFIILGVDGVRPHQHINDKMFPTDFLAIVAGVGCIVSSGITLVIFFPRSIEGEMVHREQRRTHRKRGAPLQWTGTEPMEEPESHGTTLTSFISIAPSKMELDELHYNSPFGAPLSSADVSMTTSTRVPSSTGGHGDLPSYEAASRNQSREHVPSFKVPATVKDLHGGSIALKPNRLNRAGDVELGAVLTESEMALVRVRTGRDRVSRLVSEWRSPIDIERPERSTVGVGRWNWKR